MYFNLVFSQITAVGVALQRLENDYPTEFDSNQDMVVVEFKSIKFNAYFLCEFLVIR